MSNAASTPVSYADGITFWLEVYTLKGETRHREVYPYMGRPQFDSVESLVAAYEQELERLLSAHRDACGQIGYGVEVWREFGIVIKNAYDEGPCVSAVDAVKLLLATDAAYPGGWQAARTHKRKEESEGTHKLLNTKWLSKFQFTPGWKPTLEVMASLYDVTLPSHVTDVVK